MSSQPARDSCRSPFGDPELGWRAVVKPLKSRSRHEKRCAERTRVGWNARYRLDSHGPWLTCRVVDVSLDGAALELPENVSTPRSRLLFLELGCGEETSSVALRADVRSLSFAPNGHHRIGVMFVNVTSIEHQYLVNMIARSAEVARGAEARS
jgi:hypothetical protein